MKSKSLFVFLVVLLFSPFLSNAQVYILNEDFATAIGTNPPAGWSSVTDTGGPGDVWHFDNPGNRIINYPVTGKFAIFDSHNYSMMNGPEDVMLESPSFDASIGVIVILMFDHYFVGGDGGHASIEVFNGSSWTIVTTYDSTTLNPERVILNISNQASGITNARVRFHWTGNSSNWWAIDNIRIYAPLSWDAGITSVQQPITPLGTGISPIKVQLENFGANVLTGVQIHWMVNDTAKPVFNWTGNIAFNNRQDSIEIGSLNFLEGHSYEIKVWTEYPNMHLDVNRTNDTTSNDYQTLYNLCGTYTIGGVNPDFTSMSEAAHALNNAFLTCPVVFKIRNGTYDEQIELNDPAGSSSFNTTTFESESGDSSQVILFYDPAEPWSHVVKCNGSKNVIFKNITFQVSGNWAYTLMLTNNCNNITIGNCGFTTLSSSGYLNLENSGNISITNNRFTNMDEQISISGGVDVTIRNNIFILSGSSAIDIYSQNHNLAIAQNSFTGPGHGVRIAGAGNYLIHITNNVFNTCNGAIYHSGESQWVDISSNKLFNCSEYGLWFSGIQSYIAIVNNFIHATGTPAVPVTGLYIENSGSSKVVFNSINILNTNVLSRAVFVSGGDGLTACNNIFSNPGGGYAVYYDNPFTNSVWDYNDYYSATSRLGYHNDTIYSSLQVWSNLYSIDAHTFRANPFFSSDSILSIHQVLLNNTGLPVSDVIYDIDSTLRTPGFPDRGAREYNPCAVDAGINEVTSPFSPIIPGLNPVKVILQNQGLDPLTNVIIHWEISGDTLAPYTWSGYLAGGENTEVEIGTYNFLPVTTYQVRAWTSDPDGLLDCSSFNDETVSQYIYPALCGIYTIGGAYADFQTITSAVDFLNNAGITCPVIFNIRNGFYDEQFEIEEIHGSSGINTVTFQSESGDSSAVIVFYNPLQPYSFAIKCNRSRNLIFKGITVEVVSNFTSTFNIANHCENITIRNCHIHTSIQSGYLSIDKSEKINILNTRFTNKDEQIILTGTNNVLIKNNIFLLPGSFGIDIYTLNRNLVITGNTFSGSGYGIRVLGSNNDTMSISWNVFRGCEGAIAQGGSATQLEIMNNRILHCTEFGIYCFGERTNLTMVNNLINGSGAAVNPVRGLQLEHLDHSNILFNSINITNTNYSSKAIHVNGGHDLLFENNIFSNKGGGFALYYDSLSPGSQWNYNDYFSSKNRLVYYDQDIYSSLQDWRTLMGMDSASIEVNPFFSADTNPRINQILLNNIGMPVPGVLIDIDSSLRDPVNPDIGAYEFTPCATDAGINSVKAPVNPVTSGQNEVKVILTNQGFDTLTSVVIHWRVNNFMQTDYLWTGILPSAGSEELTIGSYNFLQNIISQIQAWTSDPNNIADCKPVNDSSFSQPLYSTLCGTYTIGGSSPDFNTIGDATGFLNNAGVACPVVFKIRNGTYFEVVELQNIPGTSAINTVTFESESGDSSQVILAAPLNNLSLKLNRTSFTTFKKVQFANLVLLAHKSSNIEFTGCMAREIVIQDSNNYIRIENCRIEDSPNDAIAVTKSGNIDISGNYFIGTKERCIFYDEGNYGSLVISHNVIKDQISQSSYAIFVNSNIDLTTVNVLNNSINNCYSGIYLLNSKIGNIQNNSIIHFKFIGLRAEKDSGTVVSDNFLQSAAGSVFRGIDVNTSYNVNVFYNSVLLLGNSPESMAIWLFPLPTGLHQVKNNIFANLAGGYAAEIYQIAGELSMDFNDYFSSALKTGNLETVPFYDLPSWGAAVGGEANGKSLNPMFANDSSFHLYQRGLNGAGIPIAGILYDIEGETRNIQAPDIGCDESMWDFGITQLLSPTLSCAHSSLDPVTIFLRQFGDVPFIDTRVAYTVNNGPVHLDTIAGMINSDLSYTFQTPVSMQDTGGYTFKVWLYDNNDDNIANDTLEVLRYSIPVPAVSFSAMNGNCTGSTFQFIPEASVMPPYFLSSWLWIFGDGDTSFLQNATHIYNNGGIYPVTMRVFTNVGCMAEQTQAIQVLPSPGAVFLHNDVCHGDTVYFSNQSQANGTGPLSYHWDFGDGDSSSASSPSHFYVQPGSFMAILFVSGSNGCIDSLVQTVHDYPPVIASAGPDTIICGEGTAFLTASGGTNYLWNIQPPSATASVWVNPSSTTTYAVTVSDDHGCSGRDSVSVMVGGCIGGTVQYDNVSGSPVNSTTVYAMQGSTAAGFSLTNNYGQFLIKGLLPGQYQLDATTTKPLGSVNATDCLLILEHFAGIQMLTGMKLEAGDVNLSGYINSTDSYLTSKRFLGLITSFPQGDWLFQHPAANVAGTATTMVNFRSICYGDVNGSYIPSYKAKQSVYLTHGKEKYTGSTEPEIIPILARETMNVCAVSLVIDLPEGVDIKDVRLAKPASDQGLEQPMFFVNEHQLRISWYDLVPLSVSAGDPLLFIETVTNETTVNAWSLSGESVLSDQAGRDFSNIELDIPVIENAGDNVMIGENYPNPFNAVTTLSYFLPWPASVKISLLNGLGQTVGNYSGGYLQYGRHQARIENNGLTSGVYFIRLFIEGGGRSLIRIKPVIIGN